MISFIPPTRAWFRRITSYCMLYFAAAITYEHRYAEGVVNPMDAFLCAGDARLVDVVAAAQKRLAEVRQGVVDRSATQAYADEIRRWIAPYNIARLCDPTCNNMYRYTTAPA